MNQSPNRLWVVRHGESAGNLALNAAETQGAHLVEVSARDADVPLSPLGERQAAALGRFFAARPEPEVPTLVVSSPYRRAHDTARIFLSAGGFAQVPCIIDERLREKEFGALNRLTKTGILASLPEQAALRKTLGKFYYRPPGGESWCDIVLRLRCFWSDLRQEHPGERVLVICHSVVTFCLRYIIEGLNEEQVLALDASHDVANCAITSYVARLDPPGRARLVLDAFNLVAPLEEAGEPVTKHADAPLPK